MPDPFVKYPKISIITPSFNQGHFIEQSIQSLVDQNYPNLEYIIFDGGSTDITIEIIKKYERFVNYWVSEPDEGQTDAINKAYTKCTGDIINWLNSDDYYEPGTLHKIAELFTNNPLINVVCGKEWSFKTEEPIKKSLNHGSIIKTNVFETIRIGVMDQPCTFFRKQSIDSFFPLNTLLRYVMDRQLWWCYLLKYGQQGILQTDFVFTNFRLHAQSKSISEGELFENEFDGLKKSLFTALDAPEILKSQLAQNLLPLDCTWQIKIAPRNFILAEFASFYALRSYVRDELNVTSQLMRLVCQWKGIKMNQSEWYMWIKCRLIPKFVLIGLKKLNKSINFF